MKAALKWGVGDIQTEKGPRRVQPTKALTKSTRDGGLHSAPALQNQAYHVLDIRRGRQTLSIGGVTLATTSQDDPQRYRRQAAIATRILAQMRRLHEMSGGPGDDLQRCEVWFEIALSQFTHIAASRPKWTWGPMAWARRYVPTLCAARPETWFQDRIRAHRQDRRFYSSASAGTMLGVTRKQFMAGRLWHIWPAGMSAEDRKRLSLDNKAAWARGDRLLRNPDMTPRVQAICNTNARLPGESKSAFYRRMAKERAHA